MRWCWSICLFLTRRPWSTQEVPLFISLCCAGLSPQGSLSHNLDKHLRCQEILSTWQLMANPLRWNFAHLWKCPPKIHMNTHSGHWQVLEYTEYTQIHKPSHLSVTWQAATSLYPWNTRPQRTFHLLQCCHLVAPCCSMCSMLNCFSNLSTHLTETTLHGNNGCHVNWGVTNSLTQSFNQSINQSHCHSHKSYNIQCIHTKVSFTCQITHY